MLAKESSSTCKLTLMRNIVCEKRVGFPSFVLSFVKRKVISERVLSVFLARRKMTVSVLMESSVAPKEIFVVPCRDCSFLVLINLICTLFTNMKIEHFNDT